MYWVVARKIMTYYYWLIFNAKINHDFPNNSLCITFTYVKCVTLILNATFYNNRVKKKKVPSQNLWNDI